MNEASRSDVLPQVNGQNVEGLRHSEVVALIRGGEEVHLLVVDQETDDFFQRLGITPSISNVKGQIVPHQQTNLPATSTFLSSSSPQKSTWTRPQKVPRPLLQQQESTPRVDPSSVSR